jgi:hypothetical protein
MILYRDILTVEKAVTRLRHNEQLISSTAITHATGERVFRAVRTDSNVTKQ